MIGEVPGGTSYIAARSSDRPSCREAHAGHDFLPHPGDVRTNTPESSSRLVSPQLRPFCNSDEFGLISSSRPWSCRGTG